MKAAAFDYMRAHSLEQVFEAFAAHGQDARILAGGQSLVPILNLRMAEPKLLVDITGIAALRGITETPAGLRIGALVRHVELLRDSRVAALAPLIARAVPHVAHAAIRNRGTIGGSLALSDPAAEYPPVALVSGAVLHLHGPAGRRDVAAGDFFRGIYDTALQTGELIEAVTIPPPPPGTVHDLQELARRHGDYAIIGLVLRCRVEAGRVRDLRASFINGGSVPALLRRAAAAAEGLTPADAADAAASAVADDIDLPSDLQASAAMRLHLGRVLLRRSLRRLAA